MGKKMNSEKLGNFYYGNKTKRRSRHMVRLYPMACQLEGDGKIHDEACEPKRLLPVPVDGKLSGSA